VAVGVVAVDVLEVGAGIAGAADVLAVVVAEGGTRTSLPRICTDHTDRAKAINQERPQNVCGLFCLGGCLGAAVCGNELSLDFSVHGESVRTALPKLLLGFACISCWSGENYSGWIGLLGRRGCYFVYSISCSRKEKHCWQVYRVAANTCRCNAEAVRPDHPR